MRLIKKIRLAFREGKSDKIYEVDLVELPGDNAARFLVNFRYGRRGSTLREGTKTANPVTLAEAEDTYRSVVVSKTNDGYYDEAGPAPVRTAPAAPTPVPDRSIQEARYAALLKGLSEATDSKKRARIIWNLGHGDPSEAAVRAVIANVNRGDWIEDYSIAWTLGRWRDGAGIATLEKLQRHANQIVRDAAFESLLLTSTPSAVANLLQADKSALPATLVTAIDSENSDDIARVLQALPIDGSFSRTLISCYRLALFAPALKRALLTFFASCALAPGIFKAVRHVFKAAELRLDEHMFACLAHRFETTKAFFRHGYDRIYIPGQGSIVVSKELASDRPRLAYSNRTREYLRKRAWRTLLRLGRADSERYVQMAKALLLQVKDSDAVEPRIAEVYKWDEDGERSRSTRREFGPYAHLLVFNYILHGADRTYQLGSTRKAWFRTGKRAPAARGETFAHLWDQAPAAAFDLLKTSRCSAVHDAAIAMLAGQTQFLSALSGADVAQLVVSTYSQTAQFALPLARALFERGAGDDHLLLALLQSPLEQAREFGVQLLSSIPNWHTNVTLLIELLLIFAPPVPGIVESTLSKGPALSESDQQQVVTGVIGQLCARNLTPTREAAELLARIVTTHLQEAIATLALTLVDRLLTQPDVGRQLIGARLLVANNIAFKDIPERLLQHIHGSVHEETRAIAIALLSKQRPEDLLQQAEALAELLYQGAAAERRELFALFATLAAKSPESEAQVVRALSSLLFRGERDVGQADELYEFFVKHRDAANAFDKDMVWRLLQAQATAAQRVGALLLQGRVALDFSVRQWARLAQHTDVSARRYAMAAYDAHEHLVKQNTTDALRLFDSKWDDAREFGFNYFRTRYVESDWSPEYIVGICDSIQPDVQAFGRELLQRFFQLSQGPQYLTTLSEHPSVNVQLFVSNFLEQHAAGHTERIFALRGYFVTVLSQINKARICKDRVVEFLLREALRDRSVAQMVAALFGELSLTVVRKDRSQLIKAMIALQNAFPDLSVPIKALAVRSRTAAVAAAESAGGI